MRNLYTPVHLSRSSDILRPTRLPLPWTMWSAWCRNTRSTWQGESLSRTPIRRVWSMYHRRFARQWSGPSGYSKSSTSTGMDQLREIVNRVTVLELMVSGKFV